MVSLPERAPRRLPLERERETDATRSKLWHTAARADQNPPRKKEGVTSNAGFARTRSPAHLQKGLCRPVEVCAFGVCEDVRIWKPCGIQTRIVLLLSAALACAGSGAKARQAITGFILLRTTSSSRQRAVVAFLSHTARHTGGGASGLRRDEAHLLPIDAGNLC